MGRKRGGRKEKFVDRGGWGRLLLHFEILDSTQDEAKRLYKKGELLDGTLIWADAQTRGRGRRGRSWFSPSGAGLWFTVAFKPTLRGENLQLINVASALGVCAFLRKKGIASALKWPNDVIVNGRKICGILTEGIFSGGDIEFCLLGIGLNLKLPRQLPADLKGKITSVENEADISYSDRKELMKELVEEVYSKVCLLKDSRDRIIMEYRTLCDTLGRRVAFLKGGEIVHGVAYDVNDRGELLVRVGSFVESLSSEMLVEVGEILKDDER